MRLHVLASMGLDLKALRELGIGPVLFRETCSFRRELHLGDDITLRVELSGLTEDLSRFAFRHTFEKADGTFCAQLDVLGAWIDIEKRKLTAPPARWKDSFHSVPKTDDFTDNPK
jgi:acyl-CoA thioester hydrolase